MCSYFINTFQQSSLVGEIEDVASMALPAVVYAKVRWNERVSHGSI